MKLRLTAFVSKPAFAAAMLLSAVLVAGLGIGAAANPDAMVTRSFTAALDSAGVPGAGAKAHAGALVAGTEEFWLDQKRKHDGDGSKLQAAAWVGSETLGLSVGDHISIANGGATRVLEVISISDIPASKTQIQVGPAGVHQVSVTCRDTASADGQLVTFVTSASQPANSPVKHPQAL
jgi:hypothetical protein